MRLIFKPEVEEIKEILTVLEGVHDSNNKAILTSKLLRWLTMLLDQWFAQHFPEDSLDKPE